MTKLLSITAAAIIIAPLVSLMAKVPWSNFLGSLSDLTAIKLSIWTSTLAAVISLTLGVPLAWILAKSSNRISNLIRPLVLAPIVLPPTVAGIALISLMGRNGLLGKYIYEITGWSMPFTSSAVVLAGIFVGLPFVVLICESNFRQLPKEIEDAAIIDRVSGNELFQKIAIPQSRSAIATGGILAWARAMGEFGATLMFAGSLPGVTQTWTMLIYQELDVNVDTAYVLSAVMLVIGVLIVFLLRKPLREAMR
ncbi:MAG: molybdate ABC transporter permease subunit [Candidatus Nanopelagicaceae bacterium]|nr:molybdate ABC transporter permease subunit [Candidatus Nanopelagicaceae bacterium]